ncbi:hypothetical protein EIP86_006022 [Pleurotus ostreatoroseus]|nr:hypothetical protein EIP86_006022 [Pleurotus ostreatoroseus]
MASAVRRYVSNSRPKTRWRKLWLYGPISPPSLSSPHIIHAISQMNVVLGWTAEWDLLTYAQVPVNDLSKRQAPTNITDDHIYTFGTSPDVSRIPLYPPNSTLAPNATDLSGLDIQLTCVDCGFKSNFSIGVDFVITLDNPTCVPSPTQNCFGLTTMNTDFTVIDLEQDASLEVFLGNSISRAGNYTVALFPLEPGFQFGTMVNIGPNLGLEIMWDFDASGALNFTYGASAQYDKGAVASLNFLNAGGLWDPMFTATGWNNFSLNQLPFRINEGQLNITTSVALAPFAELAFIVDGIGAAARLTATIPRVAVNAKAVSDVDRQCNPIGSDTYESFSLAFEIAAGMGLSSIAHFEVDDGFFVSSTGIPNSFDHTLFSDEVPLIPGTEGTNNTGCFIIVDDEPANASNTTANTSSSAVASANTTATVQGIPASTGTLLTAASAVPTWNFTKIESFFSANGQLPTGVNYTQMVQATSIPADLQQAVTHAVSGNSSSGSVGSGSNATTGGNNTAPGGSGTATAGSGISARKLTSATMWLCVALLVIASNCL